MTGTAAEELMGTAELCVSGVSCSLSFSVQPGAFLDPDAVGASFDAGAVLEGLVLEECAQMHRLLYSRIQAFRSNLLRAQCDSLSSDAGRASDHKV